MSSGSTQRDVRWSNLIVTMCFCSILCVSVHTGVYLADGGCCYYLLYNIVYCFSERAPISERSYGKDELDGEALGHPSSAFAGARQAMVRGLLASLSGRFEVGTEGIIATSAIANLKLWPKSLPGTRPDFNTNSQIEQK